MAKEPWHDWIPGVLSKRQVQALVDNDKIRGLTPDRIDASSFDITISAECYRLLHGSVKPSGRSFVSELKSARLVEAHGADGDSFLLNPRSTYLFRAEQSFSLQQELGKADFHGQATARSSVGRLDVLARLVVDGMAGYEGFDPKSLERGNGELYVEVTPLSFPIRVKAGTPISQLRLFFGAPRNVEIDGKVLWRTVCAGPPSGEPSLLTLDLSPAMIGGNEAVAFSPRESDAEKRTPVPLFEPFCDPRNAWRLVPPQADKRLRIEAGRFYILRSAERLRVPSGIAIYCRASDETIGEMRIHYAGFVHPNFGRQRTGDSGTPLIFEVRGHDFPVHLRHGEQMARLSFYRMSHDAESPQATPSGPNDPYQTQNLQLSKFFDSWPQAFAVDGEGVPVLK